MRFAGLVGMVAVLASAATVSGCRCTCGSRDNDGLDAGDGFDATAATDAGATDGGALDASSDGGAPPCVGANVPALGVGDVFEFSFCPPDPQIADLVALYALDPAAIEMQFETENPARGPYDFGAFGSRWVAAEIDNPNPDGTGTTTVRVLSDELDPAMLCITPDNSTYFIHDDFVGAPPNAGLILMLQGTWTCLATVSPHTDNVPLNMPFGVERFDVAAN